jgi:hypothetical protein
MGLSLLTSAKDYKDLHKGSTIWVLGSGKSLDHVPRWFWSDRIVVAVNYVGVRLGLQEFYTVTHYHCDAAAISEQRPDLPIIAPKIDQGGPAAIPVPPVAANIFYINTGTQRYSQFDCAEMWPKQPDTLVIGPTSLHMAMHFAQYLGARHIILAGTDCGLLDSASNFDGYSPGDNPMPVWDDTLPKVANQLRSEGVSVMSLNPFVNFGLEGHQYHSPSTRIN